ncbi:ring finger protein 167 [Trichuris trichiura]|uniref:Ring finger protein 167 n=1 Tax=Trichuris trichiura TaxID=36087 RepID=A0A077ZII0_TRITR|nr:ring finger protein 167 [Trichuris trichiura]
MERCQVNDLSALKCGHTFHAECVRRWLLSNPYCPTCRCPCRANSCMYKLQLEIVGKTDENEDSHNSSVDDVEFWQTALQNESNEFEAKIGELESETKKLEKHLSQIATDLKLCQRAVKDVSKVERANAKLKADLTKMKKENDILKRLVELDKTDALESCISGIEDIAALKFCVEVMKRKHKELMSSCSKEAEESLRANSELARIRKENAAMRQGLTGDSEESSISSKPEQETVEEPAESMAAGPSSATGKGRRNARRKKRPISNLDEEYHLRDDEDDESDPFEGFSMTLRSGVGARALRYAFSSDAQRPKKARRK